MHSPCTVACSVWLHQEGAWLVQFEERLTLTLKTEDERARFAVACGALKAPKDWDGSRATLDPEEWKIARPWDIQYCPEEYYWKAEEAPES